MKEIDCCIEISCQWMRDKDRLPLILRFYY